MSFLDKFNFLSSQTIEVKDIVDDLSARINSDINTDNKVGGVAQSYHTNNTSSLNMILTNNDNNNNYYGQLDNMALTQNLQSNYSSNLNSLISQNHPKTPQPVRMDQNSQAYIISGNCVPIAQNQQNQNVQLVKIPQSNIYNVVTDSPSKQSQNQQYSNQQKLILTQGGARVSEVNHLSQNVQQNNPSQYNLNCPTGVKEIIEEIFLTFCKTSELQFDYRTLIALFLNCEIDTDYFIKFVYSGLNHKIQPSQEKVLRDFQMKKREIMTAQQSNMTMNQQLTQRNVQVRSNQSQNINMNNQQLSQSNRIPQLTVVQNSQRLQQPNYSQMSQQMYSNMPSSQLPPTRQQLVPRQTSTSTSASASISAATATAINPSQYLKNESTEHLMIKSQPLNSLLTIKEPNTLAQPADITENILQEEEVEIPFDIAGINLKEEENILEQTVNFVRSKSCLEEPTFNSDKIKTILYETLKNTNLTIEDGNIKELITQLSHSLELKIRKILNDATIQVRHRLNNYQLKAKHKLDYNTEAQMSFMEEVYSLKENPRKNDRINTLKNMKSKTDSFEKQKALLKQSIHQDESNNRMNATNSMVLAAIKGGRKTDITNTNDIFNINSTSYSNLSHPSSSLSTTSQHQRLRYSAVKQRKITLRDIQLILEADPNLRRSSILEYSYYKM